MGEAADGLGHGPNPGLGSEGGSFQLLWSTKCLPIRPSWPWKSASQSVELEEKPNGINSSPSPPSKAAIGRKPGGWKAMPYILGNETFERLATFGLLANFMVYLMREYHMDQVSASNVIAIWSGFTGFAPLVGAFISDIYAGRFRTIAFASFASLLGMLTITLTAWLPKLHPPQCPAGLPPAQCHGPTGTHLAVLVTGLGFLSVGAGGIRPCSIPFGVDQFDPSTEEGQKGIRSFFNWYYTTFNIVIVITMTLIVYIQDSVSWVIGFGIPTVLMFFSLVLFFVGTRVYIHVRPEGSIFTGIFQVFAAAYRKRRLELAPKGSSGVASRVFYDPPMAKDPPFQSKLPLTDQFRYLNKAAVVLDNDLNTDGCPNDRWRLCSIQQVEEVKCLLKIVPVWASGIVSLTAISQQGTFTVSQALKMDRHLGPRFQIPAASMAVISFITVGLWLPIYDRFLVPALRKVTGIEGGITELQRMGVGIVFAVLSMIAAGVVEKERRASADADPNPLGVAPMSALWLAPQLVLLGLCDAFNIIGQIEFYNRQFPDQMRSLANSLFSCSFAGASYLSALVVNVVHHVTRRPDRPDWLTADINAGRLDYFYYLIAGMGALNFVYFLYCANKYRYKVTVDQSDRDTHLDI